MSHFDEGLSPPCRSYRRTAADCFLDSSPTPPQQHNTCKYIVQVIYQEDSDISCYKCVCVFTVCVCQWVHDKPLCQDQQICCVLGGALSTPGPAVSQSHNMFVLEKNKHLWKGDHAVETQNNMIMPETEKTFVVNGSQKCNRERVYYIHLPVTGITLPASRQQGDYNTSGVKGKEKLFVKI